MSDLRLRWTTRPEPLQAAAVVGRDDVVPVLAADTAARLARGASLSVVHTAGWVLVLGATDDLPWADRAVYLGREDGLLVPTLSEPHPGTAFLAVALPDAPLRVVLPGLLLTATLPARPPSDTQLAGLR